MVSSDIYDDKKITQQALWDGIPEHVNQLRETSFLGLLLVMLSNLLFNMSSFDKPLWYGFELAGPKEIFWNLIKSDYFVFCHSNYEITSLHSYRPLCICSGSVYFFRFLSQIYLVWTPCPWWWVAHGSVARRSNDNRERYPSREMRNWCVRGVHRKGAVNRQAFNSGTNSALGASCSGYREQTNIAYSSRVRVLFQWAPLTHVLFDRNAACYVPEKGDQAFQT